ncbi:MAG: ATP-binding protein, partial [Planctomycetota bacterium]
AQQSSRLAWVTWLAVALAVGIAITIGINRVVQIRQLTAMKERFAADLHDELGANIHVIGILSDLARDSGDSPERFNDLHQRIRTMTERSGAAVQYCTNILEAQGLYQNLFEDMKRSTERVMADIDGELTLLGDRTVVDQLNPRKRADMFLFYKECLVNISRHSEATRFDATLSVTDSELCLSVSDNGIGLNDSLGGSPPSSLIRRAKLLGARVEASNLQEGGTRITLQLPKRRKWWFNNRKHDGKNNPIAVD